MLKFKQVASSRHSDQIMKWNGFLWLPLHGRTMHDSAGKRHWHTIVNKMERLSKPSEPSRTWWWSWCKLTTCLRHSGHLQWKQQTSWRMSCQTLNIAFHTTYSMARTPRSHLNYSELLDALPGCMCPRQRGKSWTMSPSLLSLLDVTKDTRVGSSSHQITIHQSSGQTPQERIDLGMTTWIQAWFNIWIQCTMTIQQTLNT